jgi:DNA polymerase elongation subunit (family B)
MNRTAEMARLFRVDFFSVLSRGSQYRVEAVLLQVTKPLNFLLLAASKDQVAQQPGMECLPLVMEPHSKLHTDPVVVLDFVSLYPSVVIGHNICYSTCLGRLPPSVSSSSAAARSGRGTGGNSWRGRGRQKRRAGTIGSSYGNNSSNHKQRNSAVQSEVGDGDVGGWGVPADGDTVGSHGASGAGDGSGSTDAEKSAEAVDETGAGGDAVSSMPPLKRTLSGLGVHRQYRPPPLAEHASSVNFTANGCMFVPSSTRLGVLPRMLAEILQTRVMVKQSMKQVTATALPLLFAPMLPLCAYVCLRVPVCAVCLCVYASTST